jgi:hypothetical protein
MSNHKSLFTKSDLLCDQLFAALQSKIPGLQIKQNDNLCSIWSTGAIIAWVSPVRLWGEIKIWFIGESQSLEKFSATNLSLRITPIAGMWGDHCGSFKIANEAQLAEAVELLFTVSYPLTLRWFPQTAPTLKTVRAPLIADHQATEMAQPVPLYA